MDDGQGVAQALSDVKDGNGRGPLHFAARGGCNELCQYMVEELKLPVDPKDNDGMAIMDLTFSSFGAVFCVKDCFLESRENDYYIFLDCFHILFIVCHPLEMVTLIC